MLKKCLNAIGLFLFLGCVGCELMIIPWDGLKKKEDAFHEAAFAGDLATVKRFLDNGKKPDAVGLDPRDGEGTALRGTLYGSHFDVAALLVERGANVDRRRDGKSLLYRMVREDNVDAYRWLLSHGAKPDPEAAALLKLPPERRFNPR